MSTKTRQPPSRRVSWASPIITNINGETKRIKREDSLERPKKVPTTTTSPMTKLLKLDKPRAGSKPMNYDNKCSKQMNYSKKGSNSKPTSYNDKGSKPMSYDNKGSNSKPVSYNGKGSCSKGGSLLLAGYLAHEYLAKGTIMGRRWDDLPSQRVEPKQEEKHRMYMEIAPLLKTNGTQMDGIVNPTQLARSLRLM